jgi:lysozyme
MSFRVPAKAAGGFLGVALTIIMGFEGLSTYVYKDPVGIPTYCYGETENVPSRGTRFTPEQCRALLLAKLPRYDAAMMKCVSAKVVLPDERRAALISFTYNVGSSAFCKSTLVRKLNAGDTRGACNELLRWTKAGGRELRGLVNRRKAERDLCLKGLS